MRAVEKRLRERIKELEKQLETVEADRAKFREHFSRRFRWWIELAGKGQHPSVAWLIEADAKELYSLGYWWW